jgi:hypothetical protein
VEDDVRTPEQAFHPRVADVLTMKLDSGGHLLQHAVGEVVQPDDRVALSQEAFGEIAADESCDATDNGSAPARHAVTYSE